MLYYLPPIINLKIIYDMSIDNKQQELVTLSQEILSNNHLHKNQQNNKAAKIGKIEALLFTTLLLGTAVVIYLYKAIEIQQTKLRFLFQTGQSQKSRVHQFYKNMKQFKLNHQRLPQNIISPEKINQNQIGLLEISSNAKKLSDSIQQQFQFGKLVFSGNLSPNSTIDQAEYYRLNKKYNLQKQIAQKSICIISPFRNLMKYGTENASFHLFLQTINEQNYSNYHVYMIDDASIDNSIQTILSELPKYPRINNRITILKNVKIQGALANRDTTTRYHCKSGDIIMDVDGDDALIGKQTLKLFNVFYSNPDAWYVYSNFIQITAQKQVKGSSANLKFSLDVNKAIKGMCKPIIDRILLNNTYRTQFHYWSTSQLRTYLRDLYMKIPLSYLIQKGTYRYYLEASDRFVMYSLVELAGKKHTFFYEEYNYFYFRADVEAQPKIITSINPCFLDILMYTQAQSRVLIPLKNLKSLNDTAQLTQNYELPYDAWGFLARRQFSLMRCLLKRYKQIKFKQLK